VARLAALLEDRAICFAKSTAGGGALSRKKINNATVTKSSLLLYKLSRSS